MSAEVSPTPVEGGKPAVPRPENDAERVSALRALDIIGQPREAGLEDLTVLASHICETPIALITLIDADYQWFGAKVGLEDLCGTPRDVAFCSFAIAQPDLFVVPDALADERFARNPLVTAPPNIRFYAGMPLTTSEGFTLGTLCVIDRVPRVLTPKQELALRVLSRYAVTQLDLRRSNQHRRRAEQELQEAYARLERRVADRTAELEAARNRLELAIGASSIGLWEWDMKTDRFYHSPESRAQIGCSEEEMPQTWDEWKPRLHPDDLELADELFAAYVRDPSRDFESEMRVRHQDGTFRWLLTRARMYRDADGRPDRMYGSHIDITDRRVMEERLRQSREQLRALAAHLRSAREEETDRIARELHDELGSALTGTKLDIGWLQRQIDKLLPGPEGAAVRERLLSVSAQIDKTIGSVRKVCRDLRPAVLDELGLAAGMDWLAAEFEGRSGVSCRVLRPETIEIDATLAMALFRILQELLTNIARHAHARQVQVELRRRAGAWELEVTDNGCGLPPDALTRRDRFGLVGMRERVLAAGGRVSFDSPPAGGTRVVVCLPLGEPPTP